MTQASRSKPCFGSDTSDGCDKCNVYIECTKEYLEKLDTGDSVFYGPDEFSDEINQELLLKYSERLLDIEQNE